MADSAAKTMVVEHAPVIAHLKALGFEFLSARPDDGKSLGIFVEHPDLRAAERRFLDDFKPLRKFFRNTHGIPKRSTLAIKERPHDQPGARSNSN